MEFFTVPCYTDIRIPRAALAHGETGRPKEEIKTETLVSRRNILRMAYGTY
jgi:hypothetical protein